MKKRIAACLTALSCGWSSASALTVFAEIDLVLERIDGFETRFAMEQLEGQLVPGQEFTMTVSFNEYSGQSEYFWYGGEKAGTQYGPSFSQLFGAEYKRGKSDPWAEGVGYLRSLPSGSEAGDQLTAISYYLDGRSQMRIETDLRTGQDASFSFEDAFRDITELLADRSRAEEYSVYFFAFPYAFTRVGICRNGQNSCQIDFSVSDVRVSGLPDPEAVPAPGALPLFLAGASLFGLRRKLAKA